MFQHQHVRSVPASKMITESQTLNAHNLSLKKALRVSLATTISHAVAKHECYTELNLVVIRKKRTTNEFDGK